MLCWSWWSQLRFYEYVLVLLASLQYYNTVLQVRHLYDKQILYRTSVSICLFEIHYFLIIPYLKVAIEVDDSRWGITNNCKESEEWVYYNENIFTMITSFFKKKDRSCKDNKSIAKKTKEPKFPTGKTRVKKVGSGDINKTNKFPRYYCLAPWNFRLLIL